MQDNPATGCRGSWWWVKWRDGEERKEPICVYRGKKTVETASYKQTGVTKMGTRR